MVLLTDGSRAVHVLTGAFEHVLPVPSMPVVDTIGAGRLRSVVASSRAGSSAAWAARISGTRTPSTRPRATGSRSAGSTCGRRGRGPAHARRSGLADGLRARTATLRRMTRVHRFLLSLAVAAIALGALAPSVAASSSLFPVQSIGNRGTDVKAIQWLLTDRGHPVTVDGVFGEATRTAVKAFQTAQGLHANGVVGEDTWKVLIRPSGRASTVRPCPPSSANSGRSATSTCRWTGSTARARGPGSGRSRRTPGSRSPGS